MGKSWEAGLHDHPQCTAACKQEASPSLVSESGRSHGASPGRVLFLLLLLLPLPLLLLLRHLRDMEVAM